MIALTLSSATWRISFTAESPAMRRKASISSLTVAETPGMVRLRLCPSDLPSIAAAGIMKPTAARGEANQCLTVVSTGRTAS